MGLGGSAALAVAIVRALDDTFRAESLRRAHQRTRVRMRESRARHAVRHRQHGRHLRPDAAVQQYRAAALFTTLAPQVPLPIVIGISGKESLTANNVAQVRAAWQRQPARYEALFDQIDALALAGADALAQRRSRRNWAS